MNWVFDHSPYNGAFKLVHLALADVANTDNDNLVWMSREKIASKASCSVSTVDSAIDRMVKEGWLELVSKGGGRGNASTYRFIARKKHPDSGPFEETVQSGPVKGPIYDSSPITNTKNSRRRVSLENAGEAYRTADAGGRWDLIPIDGGPTLNKASGEHPRGYFTEEGWDIRFPLPD